MSYSEIKPEYYRMFQPDSPWHAGAPGWSTAPWPGWGRNPNLVGQPRVGVDGLGAIGAIGAMGAYYANKFEQPISGLGRALGGCGCKGMGDAVIATPAPSSSPALGVALFCGLGAMGIAYFALARG